MKSIREWGILSVISVFLSASNSPRWQKSRKHFVLIIIKITRITIRTASTSFFFYPLRLQFDKFRISSSLAFFGKKYTSEKRGVSVTFISNWTTFPSSTSYAQHRLYNWHLLDFMINLEVIKDEVFSDYLGSSRAHWKRALAFWERHIPQLFMAKSVMEKLFYRVDSARGRPVIISRPFRRGQ